MSGFEVAADHGRALHRLGRRRFVAGVMASSAEVVTAVLTPPPATAPAPH